MRLKEPPEAQKKRGKREITKRLIVLPLKKAILALDII
jgi:hypothetical protein